MKKIMMSTLLSGAMALGVGVAQAADVYLCAGAFNKIMDSDGVSIPMWGYRQMNALVDLATGCSSETTTGALPISAPGPTLVNPDDGTGLTIHLFNDGLPENISVVIPGQTAATLRIPQYFNDGLGRQRVNAFTYGTPSGSTVTYDWAGLKAGTFIYQSGSHAQLQVQMGLYGGLTQDFAASQVYDGILYTDSVNLFYSEIDPVLHNAVASGNYGPGQPVTSTIGYNPRYFLLNGTDVPVNSTSTGGGFTLIRFFNAGYQNHVPAFQGLTMDMIAEDGHPYTYAKQQYSVLLSAGQTADAILTPPAAGTYSFFDRMLNLTNKQTTPGGVEILASSSPQMTGSLVSFLEVAPAAVDTDGDGVADVNDNCTLVPNAGQQDSDSDGFGNICDGDLSGDGGPVNFTDYAIFGNSFNTVAGDAQFNAAADFNSDGGINFSDYAIFGSLWGKTPGPVGEIP